MSVTRVLEHLIDPRRARMQWVRWWLDLYLGVVKGHWKNSLKIGHVTNTYIGGMYAFTMNSHDPKGLMRL